MADAFTLSAQGDSAAATDSSGDRSALELAHDLAVDVFTSASIAQGDLAASVPEHVATELDGDTPAQRAINFARSAPGVTCSLVGMSRRDHVEENVAAGTFDPLGARAFDAVFE
jgi:aryl-alcohol dehydrogenase-like predicted oxidoreductase